MGRRRGLTGLARITPSPLRGPGLPVKLMLARLGDIVKKYTLIFTFILIFTCIAYGQSSSVNHISPNTIHFLSETIDDNDNCFAIIGERGEYNFQHGGIIDVYIEYHQVGVMFPKEEYYFPEKYDDIRKLKTNQITEIPSMSFNQNRLFVLYNGIIIVDSLILSKYEISDIQLCRYVVILTKEYNIEIKFVLRESLIKTLIFQEPKYFIVDTYDLVWNNEIKALEQFGNELRIGKKNGLISKKWYDLTNLLLSTMKLY